MLAVSPAGGLWDFALVELAYRLGEWLPCQWFGLG